MAFIVYATYSLAIAVFTFWFGVWMLHLIAITYGKIRLHKKSRLHQKLHQHNLFQPRSRTTSSSLTPNNNNNNNTSSKLNNSNHINNGHYDDLLQDRDDHKNYHSLHQLMHSGTVQTNTSNNNHKNNHHLMMLINGQGERIKGSKSNSNKNNSSCDYSSIINGGGAGGRSMSPSNNNSRETIINLNCEESSQDTSLSCNPITATSTCTPSATSPLSTSTSSSSSGISSIASLSPESADHHQSCDATSATASIIDPQQMALLAADNNNTSSSSSLLTTGDSSSSVDPLLLRKSAVEIASRLPKVSILKPLMGIDTNLAGNLETFFTMDYPRQSYEILFCVETEEDPVVGLCESLIEKYQGEVDARLFIGGEQVGVNPKINNMEPGYRESKYELVMISDAGIKMKPDTLMDMVEHMTEKVALVHQMPFTCDREGFAATYEKIFFGTFQSRMYLAFDCLNVVCHTGMSCLFRKKVMEQLGGLRAFGCYLAEDYFMAKGIMDGGWKTTISSYPALQNSGVCDVKTFQNRLVRWAKLRIAMTAHVVLLEPMSECLIVGAIASWGVSVLFHWDSLAFYLIHILCWFLSDWMLLTIVQNGSVSFNKFDFVVGWLFRELSGPYLFFCALWNPAIRWRTRVYKLDWGGVANEISSSTTKIKT